MANVHHVLPARAPSAEYEIVTGLAVTLPNSTHVAWLRGGHGRWTIQAAAHLRSHGVHVRSYEGRNPIPTLSGNVILYGNPGVEIHTRGAAKRIGYLYHEHVGQPVDAEARAPGAPGTATVIPPGVQARYIRGHVVAGNAVGLISGVNWGKTNIDLVREARRAVKGSMLVTVDGQYVDDMARIPNTVSAEPTPGTGLNMLRRCAVLLYWPADPYTTPYGHTAMMALAMGIPVVAKSGSIISDLVTKSGSGESAHTLEEASDAIERIRHDKRIIASMGANGKLVAGYDDVFNTIDNWKELLNV